MCDFKHHDKPAKNLLLETADHMAESKASRKKAKEQSSEANSHRVIPPSQYLIKSKNHYKNISHIFGSSSPQIGSTPRN